MAGKRVAIVQSNYIPWKGYFDLIDRVDEFILYDDMQYTRRDWRNRNRIKTAQGLAWLTIPVQVKGRYHQRIDETLVSDPSWAERHWQTLAQNYARMPGFADVAPRVEEAYERAGSLERLSDVNRTLLETVAALLGITTALSWSTDYEAHGRKTERLIALCQSAGADAYLSGPAAKAYMDEQAFADAGIELAYMDYSGYPEYPQPHPPFDHGVSILDLILSVGADAAPSYMRKSAA